MSEKKLELLIEESADLTSSPGDFGGKVESGKLLLPREIYNFFDGLGGTHDAGILIATYQHFPSQRKVLAEQLGWKEEEVQKAYENLVELVQDYVPESYLNWKPRQYGMGARMPDEFIGKTPEEIEELRRKK